MESNDISTAIRRTSVAAQQPQQQPQESTNTQQEQRASSTVDNNNSGSGNGGESEGFSFSGFFSQLLRTNPEVAGALTTFEKYIPFVLILVIKQLYDHSTGTSNLFIIGYP